MYVRKYLVAESLYLNIIYCNMAVRSLTDIYAWSCGNAVPEGECGYINKPGAHPCYNIYVTLLIVMYCIAHS